MQQLCTALDLPQTNARRDSGLVDGCVVLLLNPAHSLDFILNHLKILANNEHTCSYRLRFVALSSSLPGIWSDAASAHCFLDRSEEMNRFSSSVAVFRVFDLMPSPSGSLSGVPLPVHSMDSNSDLSRKR